MIQNQRQYQNNNRQKVSAAAVLLGIATYVSFGLAFWYGARGTAASLNTKVLSNEIVAAMLGGLVAFALFEVAIKMYIRPLVRAGITDLDKRLVRLRLFFIGGNLVCFALSFIYFALPFLSVWGDVLLNFLVLFVTLVVYLIVESRRFEDKSKIAYFVMQLGSVFLAVFGVMTVAKIFLGLLW